MAAVVFSGSGLSSAVGTCPIGMFRVELLLNKARYEGYYVFKIVHYKERSLIGHEFLAVYLRRGTEVVLVRLERRPSTRKVASSSDFWSDDSISQLHPNSKFHEFYHICTVFCEEEKKLTALDMCDICTFIRNLAPIYSVTKTRHCYWFCTAFLERLLSLGYNTPPLEEGKNYDRRGRFGWDRVHRRLVTEDSVKKQLAAITSRETNRRRTQFPLIPSFLIPFRLALPPRPNNKPWSRIGEFAGHTNVVCAVTFAPDGRHMLSCSLGGGIRTWDVSTGLEVRHPLRGHSGGVCSVAISADGHRIVSASDDSTICIWDLEAGVLITEPLRGHSGAVLSVTFSPDDRKIVSGSEDGSVRIWDAQTGAAIGTLLLRDGERYIHSVAWSADGNYIIAGSSDCTILKWDARTALLIGDPLRGHEHHVLFVCFSSDGSRIATGSGDKTIRLWDAVTGESLREPLLGHTDAVLSVAFSADGHWIASGSADNTVCIWDSNSDISVTQIDVGFKVCSVTWSPTGNYVAAAGTGATVLLFGQGDANHLSLVQRIRNRLQTLLPSGTSSRQWATLFEWVGHEDSILSVCFTPDGSHIISASEDHTIRVWDAVDNLGNMARPPLEGHTAPVMSVACAPDGNHIASASSDGSVRIWDIASGNLICPPLEGHSSRVRSAIFSPDGSRIVSGSDDHTLRIWDPHTGEPIGNPMTAHPGDNGAVAWSPDGKYILSGALDCTVRVWDALTGTLTGEPLLGNMDPVYSVSISPDGKCCVSGTADGLVRLWDATTRRSLGEPFHGHTSLVLDVAYSPDGLWIASASYDGTVRIWDSNPAGAREVATLSTGGSPAWSVDWSPAGDCVVAGSGDGKLRMWRKLSI